MIAQKFSTNLFWDIDTETLNVDEHSRFIIERVLTKGKLQDWQTLLQLFSFEKIKKEVTKIRYLDKVTLNFCSQFFHISKLKFRCYTQQPSIQELWQY